MYVGQHLFVESQFLAEDAKDIGDYSVRGFHEGLYWDARAVYALWMEGRGRFVDGQHVVLGDVVELAVVPCAFWTDNEGTGAWAC